MLASGGSRDIVSVIFFVQIFKSQDPKSLLFEDDRGEADSGVGEIVHVERALIVSSLLSLSLYSTYFLCKNFQIDKHKYTLI